ncbi:threonyl-tRNA synthetase [Desulfotomaculum nigrificans CO-1-SRB]|uniref:Threonine--tRNA ligase n=1 Tax=Desulfotomaculum nigrificans (strain DSM 14880 / VKM B-2319 / CO-1-SRB) TaxID=868595 RepID=F6B305_DESCC|nr:threonine--tRNA ligase [Desulfotomaculum nigrificans]AEF93909.1 threonyl-tRNA synthetase [Desulfotomaculum nigrificans CO-1-SRB]
MVKVTLKDGSVREYPAGTTVLEVAKSISQGLAREALVGKVNGRTVDLSYPIKEDATLELLTFNDEEGRHVYRHSTAHVLAQAVKRLFPDTKLAIGPAIQDGFYYDFDVDRPFTPAELEQIEAEMNKIIKEDLPFERVEISREEALERFGKAGEIYKVELINDLPEDAVISCYKQGDFTDLCAGPHVPSTGRLKSIKLMNIAGAYWRGSEKNKMLQRIYGTSFPKKALLDEHLFRIEEAKRRDHRKLGQELDLFSIQDEGPGFPFFHPKGMVLRNELENFWRREHKKRGYQEIRTPIILNRSLWEQSGHWAHYKENMYFTKIDDADYAVKPMNCPGSILVYKTRMHSYRDLPLRLAELGLVHRHELSGALHGLMRVRCFTQDDAHIFMLPSQIKDEIIGVIDLFEYFYKTFGLSYHVELSTRPEKSMGSDEIWELATRSLQDALEAKNMPYKVNEGDGAFYGPKIDFHLTDSLGRTWQCGTIQLDFQMPEKFDLTYVGEDGQKHRPVMIHRVVFGSIERFIGILTEHFAGAFPVWLAPVQVKVLPITDKHHDYARELVQKLDAMDIRVELDARNEKINYKIREAQTQKIPYMLVIGDREMENGTVAVRQRGKGDIGAVKMDEFIAKIEDEIKNKTIF